MTTYGWRSGPHRSLITWLSSNHMVFTWENLEVLNLRRSCILGVVFIWENLEMLYLTSKSYALIERGKIYEVFCFDQLHYTCCPLILALGTVFSFRLAATLCSHTSHT